MLKKNFSSIFLVMVTVILFAFTLVSCDASSSDILDGISNSNIEFDNPNDGDTVSNEVNIIGIATGVDYLLLNIKNVKSNDLHSEKITLVSANWEYLWDTTSFADGTYKIRVYGYTGNSIAFSTSITVNVNNDSVVNPVLTIISPSANAELSDTEIISGNLEDLSSVDIEVVNSENTAVLSVPADINGTAWSYSLNTLSLENGSYTIKAIGNKGFEEARVAVTVQNAPAEELSVTVDQPSFNETVSGIMDVSGTATGPVDRVQVRMNVNGVNNIFNAIGTKSWKCSIDTTGMENKLYYIFVYAYDASNNYKLSQTVVTVDNPGSTVPVLTITSPTANAELSDTETISGTLADLLTVDIVVIDSGNKTVVSDTASINGLNWSYSLNTLSLENGSYTIKAIGDNGLEEASVVVTVQNAPAEELSVTMVEPKSYDEVSGIMKVAGIATGPVEKVQVKMSIGYKQVIFDTTGTKNWECSIDTTGMYNQLYYIYVYAYDASGNYKLDYKVITVKN